MRLRWEYGDTVRLQKDAPRLGLVAGDVGTSIESADADAPSIWVDFSYSKGQWEVKTDALFNETSYLARPLESPAPKDFWDKLKSLFHRT